MPTSEKRKRQNVAKTQAYRARNKARKEREEQIRMSAVEEVMEVLREEGDTIMLRTERESDGSLYIEWEVPRVAQDRIAAISEKYGDISLPFIVDCFNRTLVDRMNERNGAPLWESDGPTTGSKRLDGSRFQKG